MLKSFNFWHTDGMEAFNFPQAPRNTKLSVKKLPKRVKLDQHFAGIKAGSLLFVGTPQTIDAYVRKVPTGETRTRERMHRELARQNACNATCPVSTAIFLRISAQAAIEQMNVGTAAARLVSWRAGELASWRAGELASWRAGELASWWAGGLVGWWAGGLALCIRPQTPRCPRRHLHTHFNVLHIQELLPQHSIGLQPD